MEKEIEELKNIVAVHFGALGFLNPSENEQILKDRDKVLNALNELKAIEESNPSEAMECSLKLYKMVESAGNGNGFNLNEAWKYHNTIKQYILKAQEQEKENARAFGKDIINLNKTLKQTIDEPILYASRYGNKYIVPQELFEKQCNVLSVIKEKNVNIAVLKNSPDLKYYNYHVSDWRKLIQEEFDSLKEAL